MIMYDLTDEVQVMAQRVLNDRGCPAQPSNSNAASTAGSSAIDRHAPSSTSSTSSSGYGYSSQGVSRPHVAAVGSARAPGGVTPAVAAMRSTFLQAFKDDEKRLKEAAAEAAAVAAAEAAKETAAGGICVSSLRSGWLETQRQEAQRAAAEAAVAASLASGRTRAVAPVRSSSPGSWGAGAARNEQQGARTPAQPMQRLSSAETAGKTSTIPPAAATAAAATSQSMLVKSQQVAQMAEKLLRSARVSNSGPSCGFGANAAAFGGGAGAAAGVPVAAPVAYGNATSVDLDM